MTARWLMASSLLLMLATAVTLHAEEAVGIVADPCTAQKTPAQVLSGQWSTYLFAHDFGQLCRYRAANERLMKAGTSPRVVFMGDSITEFWNTQVPLFFTDGKLDRGVSGQTTAQMLLRFRQDVIDLHPQAVHIMAGTNDVAGNTGPSTLAQVEGNLASMAELAKAHGIRVILASIPPAANSPGARIFALPTPSGSSTPGSRTTPRKTASRMSTTTTPWPRPRAA